MITGALLSLRALPREYRARLRERLEAKISPEPNTGCWLVAFINHATRYGYVAEAQLADTKLETLRAKGLAEVSR